MKSEILLSRDADTKSKGDPRLMIVRPLGPQGPKVGLQIFREEDLQKLGSEIEKLSADERSTAEGIKRAASRAEISVVDFG